MKKLLALAALLCAGFAHAQGLPFISNSQIACGQSNGTIAGCNTLPNGLALGQPASIDLTNATSLPLTGITTIASGNVLGYFGGGTGNVGLVNAVLIPAATSGGILGATGSNALAWSVAMTAGNIVVGAGAGATPIPIGFNWQPSSSNTSTAFGGSAGQTCTACTGLLAVGAFSMQNATGNNDVGVGYQAGNFISTGAQNLAIGTAALKGISGTPLTGNSNTCIGFNACTNTQGAGANNTGIGQSTLSQNTTGSFNTAIGNAVCSAGCGTTSNLVIIGTNNSCVPTSTAAANEIDLCAQNAPIFQATGTNTPSTSQTTIAGYLNAGGTAGVAIASLATCNAARQGMFNYVNNGQATPAYLGAVSTTGTVIAPVFCNGTGWVYH